MKDPEQLATLATKSDVTRRDALRLLAAGLAALQSGCLKPPGDPILPYVGDPRELRPGVAVRYASAFVLDGYAQGVIAATHEGRPTKVDGNPDHPAMRGGSTAIMQARILDLYDPQRTQEATIAGQATSWTRVADRIAALPPGKRVWIVMPPQSSPTVGKLLQQLRARFDLHVVYDSPLSRRNAFRGHALVYGEPLDQQLDLSRADVILSLDADFLSAMPMSPAWARAAAARRAPGQAMSRMWICEPMPTPTGSIADERLAIPASDVVAVAVGIVSRLSERGFGPRTIPDALAGLALQRLGQARMQWARAAADDLADHPGTGAVIAGDRQSPVVHALAQWIDHACGNIGGPVTLTRPALLDPLGGNTMAELATALREKAVDAVFVIEANPVATAPRALKLGELLRSVVMSVHAGLWPDETAMSCGIRIPLAHELESWGDARAWEGTTSIVQPMMNPRFSVVTPIEVLAVLAGDRRSAHDLVRQSLDEVRWRAALASGVVAGTAEPARTVTPTFNDAILGELQRELAARPPGSIEVALAPSQLYDGRFAANAWLQELPHSITKQTWGNAALMSPATATALGVSDADVVRITTDAGQIELPALVVATHADRSITVDLGYGRNVASLPIANGLGGDGFALRSGEDLLLVARVRPMRTTGSIVRTQFTMSEHGREIAPAMTLAALRAKPDMLAYLRAAQPSLLPEHPRTGQQWAMSIDTSICTGCSACVVACYAENNVPTVGPDQVARGRHMAWIRIDRYTDDAGEAVNQPMLCQHCENAPCEYVCPVQATVHSPDGLNEMVYNRCVGTRFCSNNCPYKVRRFNWFDFQRKDAGELQYNPDVTVRDRGVMEKCTYCVQRIRHAEITSHVEHRAIRPGEVRTACQEACPTGAIQFGSLDQPNTPLLVMRNDLRSYDVLHNLGTRPRTQYLAKITNPKARP